MSAVRKKREVFLFGESAVKVKIERRNRVNLFFRGWSEMK